MIWRDALYKTLNKYYLEEATTDAVVALYSSLYATTQVLSGKDDDDTRGLVLQMLVDMAYGLDTNPFMRAYKHQMWPVFQAAVNAYIDSMVYIDADADIPDSRIDDKIDIRTRAISCKHAIHELALMALMCEQGGGAYRRKSREMRDALLKIENKLEAGDGDVAQAASGLTPRVERPARGM